MADSYLRKHYDLSEALIGSINGYIQFMEKNKKWFKDYSLYGDLLKARKLVEGFKHG